MIVRFQSLNSTSKPKGDLFQTKKLWEELIVQRKEKPTKPKEEVSLNFISILEKGKVCYSLPLPFFLLLYFDIII